MVSTTTLPTSATQARKGYKHGRLATGSSFHPNVRTSADRALCRRALFWSIGSEKLKAMLLGESKEPLPQRARYDNCAHSRTRTTPSSPSLPRPRWSPSGSRSQGRQSRRLPRKPPTFDPAKKYPVKFLIHGGPEGAGTSDWSYRWNPEIFAANGYVVIMISFHGSTGYGQVR